MSRSARSAWIEIALKQTYLLNLKSRSARSAWIEISIKVKYPIIAPVALRTERVD